MIGAPEPNKSTNFSDYERFRHGLLMDVDKRTYRDVSFIAEEMGRILLFRDFNISLKERMQIAQRATLVALPAKKELFRQGASGDYYYIVLFGTMAVRVRDETKSGRAARRGNMSMTMRRQPARPSVMSLYRSGRRPQARQHRSSKERSGKMSGSQALSLEDQFFGARGSLSRSPSASKGGDPDDDETNSTVIRHSSGEGFGGLAIRNEQHTSRKASVIAETAAELLRVDAEDYRQIILKHEEDRLKGPINFLQSVPLFRMLAEEELTRLAWNATTKRFPLGSNVAQQGQLVDETRFFGILRIGRCRIFKRVAKDGSGIALADLTLNERPSEAELDRNLEGAAGVGDEKDAADDGRGGEATCKAVILNDGQDTTGDDGEGDGSKPKPDSLSEPATEEPQKGHQVVPSLAMPTSIGSGVLRKPGPRKPWYSFYFGTRRAGDVLAHRGMLFENAARTHAVTIVAETCVEVVYIPQNSLFFALRLGKHLEQLRDALPSYPPKERLCELVHQERVWKRFQVRYVREVLESSPRGAHMLQRMTQAAREQDAKRRARAREKACAEQHARTDHERRKKVRQRQGDAQA